MTFKSELIKEIENLVFDGNMDTWKDDFNKTISAIKILISKYAPKEKYFGKDFNEDSNCDFNYVKGWNDYRAELFKEIGL